MKPPCLPLMLFSLLGALLPSYIKAQVFLVARALEIGGMLPYLLEKELVVNAPHKVTFYLNEGGTPVAEAQAFRRVEVSFRDSAAGVVRLYYPSGKLYKSTPYANLTNELKHGVETIWSENGQMLMRTAFFAGLANEITTYYPNGRQLRSHMQKLPDGLKAEAFDSLGRRGHYELSSELGENGRRVPIWVSEEKKPVRQLRKQNK